MKFTITGIQYQMTAADAGERKQQAIAFVCSMKPGTTNELTTLGKYTDELPLSKTLRDSSQCDGPLKSQ